MKIDLWHGDCLELMKNIPDDYKSGLSMRAIAIKYSTNHKRVSRILKKRNILTRPSRNTRNIRKFTCKKTLKYNNMATHLRWDVSIDWLMQFEDFEKLKFLNKSLTNRDNRFPFSDTEYKEFIIKFYHDGGFNIIYKKWLNTNDKQLRPSLDHIIPRSKKGTNELSNLQFLTWFENRCKNSMSQQEWNNIKNNIQEYLT